MMLGDVYEAIQEEMRYQDDKWGRDKQQSLPGYMLVMENELRKAREGWCANKSGRESALAEILQTVTVGIRCLKRYGVTGWAEATDDIAEGDWPSIELDDSPNVKVVKLTLRNGSAINIAKAVFVRVISKGRYGSSIITANGAYDVEESAAKVQQLFLD